MTLTDGTAFSNTAIKHVDTFIYSRKYSSTQWMTTVLPIALNYSDWSDNFEIANITGVNLKLDANKQVQSFTINVSILQAGATTNPNQPYLIRAKVANANTSQSIRKTNCDVYPATPKELIFTSGDYNITFKGTYKKINTSTIYTSSKEVWSPATSIGPYRVYASVLKKEQEVSPDPAPSGDIEPQPDSSIQQQITNLANRITQLDQRLEAKFTQLLDLIGSFNDSTNETINGSINIINLAINDLNSRINTLESAMENYSPGEGTSNAQYEQRISDLETKLGKIHFEVTP